jgi:hypothetical protein
MLTSDVTSAVGWRIAALAKVLSALVDDVPCVGGGRVRPLLARRTNVALRIRNLPGVARRDKEDA